MTDRMDDELMFETDFRDERVRDLLAQLEFLQYGETIRATPTARFAAFQQRLSAERRATPLRQAPKGERFRLFAAGTAVLLSIAAFAWIGIPHFSQAPRQAKRVYATATAQQATLTLPDGSHITLAPRSRLIVDPDFGRATRTVTLEGEGYFDVSPHVTPFVVRTNAIMTRVLGTTFDIRQLPGNHTVDIAVATGKVVVDRRGIPVTITAGMIGHITDSTASVMLGDVGTYTEWTRGQLVFKNTPVPTLLAAVGRWYGYDFHLADSTLQSQYVTAIFRLARQEETMVALQDVLNVTMTFNGTSVTLHPRNPAHMRPTPRPRHRGDTIDIYSREVGK